MAELPDIVFQVLLKCGLASVWWRVVRLHLAFDFD
jgi:hypothetical protein